MNKPEKFKVIMKVEDDYCKKLLNIFDNDYNKIDDTLYNRNNIFKKVNCNFIIDNFTSKNKTKINNFFKISQTLIEKLEFLYGPGKFSNIQIAKMKGESKILPHTDDGLEFVFSHRIHIPLITNKKVIFRIENEEFYFSSGNVYEINNLKHHSVDNNNKDFNRIHLILDYVSNEYLPFLINRTRSNINNLKYY